MILAFFKSVARFILFTVKANSGFAQLKTIRHREVEEVDRIFWKGGG